MSKALVDYLEHIAKIGMYPEITEFNITKMEMCAANFWASKNDRFEADTARLRNSK